jgi:hypothetical protein
LGDQRGSTPDDATVIRRFAGEPVDQDTIAHYRGLLHHRLLINRCNDCGLWHHPPRPLCPSCWSFDVGVQPVTGAGAIALLTFLTSADGASHPVVTVDLDEQRGVRYTATLVELESPGTVAIDDRVELAWFDRGDVIVPAFRPVGSSA